MHPIDDCGFFRASRMAPVGSMPGLSAAAPPYRGGRFGGLGLKRQCAESAEHTRADWRTIKESATCECAEVSNPPPISSPPLSAPRPFEKRPFGALDLPMVFTHRKRVMDSPFCPLLGVDGVSTNAVLKETARYRSGNSGLACYTLEGGLSEAGILSQQRR